jgi:hypothetical protein
MLGPLEPWIDETWCPGEIELVDWLLRGTAQEPAGSVDLGH